MAVLAWDLSKNYYNNPQINKIFATYRQPESATDLLALEQQYPDIIHCLAVDITNEEQIAQAVAKIREQQRSSSFSDLLRWIIA